MRFLAEEVRRQVGQGEIAQVGVDVVGGTRLAPGKQRAGVGEDDRVVCGTSTLTAP